MREKEGKAGRKKIRNDRRREKEWKGKGRRKKGRR